MRVSKIPVPAGSGYLFLIFVFYSLRVLSVGTDFFDIPKQACLSTLRGWKVFEIWLMKYMLMDLIYPLLVIMKSEFHFSTRKLSTFRSCCKIINCNGVNMIVLLCRMHGLIKSNDAWLTFWWAPMQGQCLSSSLMTRTLWK